jgi:hypothetical protein
MRATGPVQCEFRRNRSKNDQICHIRQILVKRLDYNGTVRQPFIDLKKACDWVRREVLHNVLIESEISSKLVRLINMCLNETHITVRISKNLSKKFPIQNGLKQGDALSLLFFNSALEYAKRRVQENQKRLKLSRIHQILAYAGDVNIV